MCEVATDGVVMLVSCGGSDEQIDICKEVLDIMKSYKDEVLDHKLPKFKTRVFSLVTTPKSGGRGCGTDKNVESVICAIVRSFDFYRFKKTKRLLSDTFTSSRCIIGLPKASFKSLPQPKPEDKTFILGWIKNGVDTNAVNPDVLKSLSNPDCKRKKKMQGLRGAAGFLPMNYWPKAQQAWDEFINQFSFSAIVEFITSCGTLLVSAQKNKIKYFGFVHHELHESYLLKRLDHNILKWFQDDKLKDWHLPDDAGTVKELFADLIPAEGEEDTDSESSNEGQMDD